MSAYLFLIPFSTIFIAQLAPLSLLSPYEISAIPTISMFFPMTPTLTLLSLLSPHDLITRYQEPDLLVVDFGLLRAISTILMISLPPSKLVSVFIFNPFFNHFYCPTCPTVPILSLCFPMSPYVISMVSTFFPTLQTPTLLSLSFSS